MKSAISFLREHAARGEVIVLAPSPEAADDFVRRACDRALIGVHRFTPIRLAWAIAEPILAESGHATIKGVGEVALAARVIHLERRKLSYFAPVCDTPGFPIAVARTLRELRMQRISPADVQRAPAAGPDMARLLRTYNDELLARKLVDEAGLFFTAAAAIRSGAHRFAGLPLLFFDFQAETRAECELLDALHERAPGICLIPALPEDRGGNLGSLQRFLFQPGEVPDRPRDGSFELFSASTEALECVEIARRIRQSAGKGIPFDQVAILLREPGVYQPLVAEALRRAGIPAWFARGALRPAPAGRAFLTLLACRAEGFSAARFAEYISLGQSPNDFSNARCERVLLEMAVHGGYERWHSRVAAAVVQYAAELETCQDERRRAAIERNLAAAHQLREFALPLIDRLAAVPASATWGQWFDHLGSLAEAALAEPDPVLNLLEELAPMGDAGPVDLAAVRLMLGDRLRALGGEPASDRYGRVFVGSIQSAAGMQFREIFIPGLCEGIFPKPVLEDPLLIDSARREVSQELQGASEDRERRLLEQAVRTACESAVLSYPRMDVLAGRERVPSLYVFEAVRAALGSAYDLGNLGQEARTGTQTQLAWPAPANESDAIDVIEYDLALLKRVFSDGEKGGAAYLKQVSPILLDTLKARGRRWRKLWYAEDGLVDAEIGTIKLLEEHLPSARPYSPTALQRFAACPYQFLLASVVGMHAFDHPLQNRRMDPATRGDIFHRVVAGVLNEIERDGCATFRAEDLGSIYAMIDRSLDRVLRELQEEIAPEAAALWRVDIEELRRDLRGWAEQKAWDDADWQPIAWELGFGLPLDSGHHRLSVLEPVAAIGALQLRGSIDLVEKHTSGLVRVVDFKTGRAPDPAPQITGKGQVLQPALYALAASEILGTDVASGRLYYATMRGNYRFTDIRNDERTRTAVRAVAETIGSWIRKGFLPPAPAEDACKRCDYLPVCGPYEEERVRIKDQSELVALTEIRRCQ